MLSVEFPVSDARMIRQDTFFRLLAWAVAFAEGFSTLAVEVIAIRLAIPVVGSSMTLTGVLLAVILFALSAGYWHGGQLSSRWSHPRMRTALTVNLFLAGAIYAAVSFPFEAALLERFLDAGLSLAPAIGAAATLLFAVPVYLVAQSVPLLAELTNDEGKAGKASGRVLFYSTLGSVAGGIVTPVFLFPKFGVRASGYAICGLLFAAAALWTASHRRRWMIVAAGAAALAVVSRAGLGSPVPANQRFRFDSPHQTIRIVEERRASGRMERAMYLNGGRASAIFADTGETSVGYVLEADRLLAAAPCALVLAVGAAGFTFPRDVSALPEVERVDAVDVDPDVLDIAERHFLPQPLPAKVRFVPVSARYALRRAHAQGALRFHAARRVHRKSHSRRVAQPGVPDRRARRLRAHRGQRHPGPRRRNRFRPKCSGNFSPGLRTSLDQGRRPGRCRSNQLPDYGLADSRVGRMDRRRRYIPG